MEVSNDIDRASDYDLECDCASSIIESFIFAIVHGWNNRQAIRGYGNYRTVLDQEHEKSEKPDK